MLIRRETGAGWAGVPPAETRDLILGGGEPAGSARSLPPGEMIVGRP